MGSQVVSFMAQNSVEELLKIMGGSPFDYLDPKYWVLTLFVSTKEIPDNILNPGYSYRVKPVSSQFWYDETLGKTDLVIIFESEDIKLRTEIFKQQGYVSAYSDIFIPYMVLVRGFPPLSSANKSFMRSITLSLRSTPHNFIFNGETAVESGDFTIHEQGMKHFADRLLR